MTKVNYSVPNINCNHCVHTIQSEVSELEGVHSVVANTNSRHVEIEFDDPANEEKIKALLSSINYPVVG
jgi:copper chaperone